VELPAELLWSAHRADTDPVLGWYSPRFGHKVASTTLVGTGRIEPDVPVVSRFRLRC
jgi:hypothetical protein